MSHDHSGHGHEGHHHPAPQFNRAFLIAIIANAGFVILQVIYAYLAHSTSLLADAMHNLGDVLALILAWIANGLLQRSPTMRTTYGMKKSSILAALANGTLLVFTCGIIATEAIYKFFTPTPIEAVSVMVVATIGILINGTTAALFIKGSDDINIRSAFLHLLYDAFISFGVVVSAALLYWTNWLWLDPLVGLLIALIIIKGTWSLFTESFRMIIDGVPSGISVQQVSDFLNAAPGVESLHDLHIWALSTQENALSVHLLMPEAPMTDKARQNLAIKLREQFNIHHVTFQIEQIETFCDDACVMRI